MKLEPSPADDPGLAAFAASIELAAVAAYAVGVKRLTGAPLKMAQVFAGHHGDHAQALNARAGTKPVTTANPKLAVALRAQFADAGDQSSVLRLAFQLENQLASTHQFLLAKLSSVAALRAAASILPVECQHAVLLGSFLRLDLEKDIVPFTLQGIDAAPTHPEWLFLDPARYPVG